MNKIKVSVCISVHNTGQYLKRCLDSVLSQTLKDIEVVIVNNGSTDNSGSIMQEYASIYKNIKVIVQEDKGLAQGRQSGVDNASGDYIAFLDADDFVLPTAYEKLYNKAISTDSDIVEMQTLRDNQIIESPYSSTINSKDILRNYFAPKVYIPQMLWLRIYSRKLFLNPVFPDLYVNNEDNFAFPCLLLNANHIAYVKEPLHVYSTDNENAVMKKLGKSQNNNQKRYLERKTKILYSLPHIENYFGQRLALFPEYRSFKAKEMMSFLVDNFHSLGYNDKAKIVREICKYSTNREMENYIKENIRITSVTYLFVTIFGVSCICKLRNVINKYLYKK